MITLGHYQVTTFLLKQFLLLFALFTCQLLFAQRDCLENELSGWEEVRLFTKKPDPKKFSPIWSDVGLEFESTIEINSIREVPHAKLNEFRKQVFHLGACIGFVEFSLWQVIEPGTVVIENGRQPLKIENKTFVYSLDGIAYIPVDQ